MNRHTRRFALAAALLAAPTALAAQQAPAAPAPAAAAPSPELQTMVTELQQLHGRLQALQERALQDAELSAAQEALGVSIKAAMSAADPALEAGMERMKTLESEVQAAQAAQDTAKLQAFSAEANRIQQQFFAAQQKVMAQPEMTAQLDAFQQQLEAKMLAVDPEAAALIARFRELEGRLQAAMGG